MIATSDNIHINATYMYTYILVAQAYTGIGVPDETRDIHTHTLHFGRQDGKDGENDAALVPLSYKCKQREGAVHSHASWPCVLRGEERSSWRSGFKAK